MILRNSISKAKKLFQTTLQTFKTMLSNGYEKLPKTPPVSLFSCSTTSKLHHSFRELDSFCNDGCGDDPHRKMKEKKTTEKLKIPCYGNKDDPPHNGSFMKFARANLREERGHHHANIQDQEGRKAEMSRGESSSSFRSRLEACFAVTQRLKELELMDLSNVDHLLDIEEVLHYYSRITCPFYIDIINKFFMEMYAEFLPQTSPGSGVSPSISNW